MNSIRDDLLRTVLENPFDDQPRLVMADWLEENGESERAEFIRLQIEMQRVPKPISPHKYRSLDPVELRIHQPDVDPGFSYRRQRATAWVLSDRRYLTGERVTTGSPFSAIWVVTEVMRYEESPNVRGRTRLELLALEMGELLLNPIYEAMQKREQELLRPNEVAWLWPLWRALGLTQPGVPVFNPSHPLNRGLTAMWPNRIAPEVSWRRGFVKSITLTCDDFLRDAGAIFKREPIVEVRLSDKRPFTLHNMRSSWNWHNQMNEFYLNSFIPEELFALLDVDEVTGLIGFEFEQEAYAALSDACVAYGRKLAGLPELRNPGKS